VNHLTRTLAIEFVDRWAKGGDSVTYNVTSLAPLNKPNLRAFFEGKGTVAQYASNLISTEVDPLHYTVTLKHNLVSRAVVERCHDLGVAVLVWTVNNRELFRRLDALGVDGVISDDPRIF